MITYTPQNQLSLDLFKHPFKTELDANNRWVILSKLISWDDIANVYGQKLSSDRGRKSVDLRTVIAAIIIKHKLGLDDRGTILMIQENPYLQYFCGLSGFTHKPVFDPSLFVYIRKRLGLKDFEKFNTHIIRQVDKLQAKKNKPSKQSSNDKNTASDSSNTDDTTDKSNSESNIPKNKGTLKIDATIADQEISHPNDVALLNKAREKLEMMIDKLYDVNIDKQKPRTYRRVARKDYLNFSKKKRKGKKTLREAIRKQLQYLKRNINHVRKMLSCKNRTKQLSKKDLELLAVIERLYQQQKYMYDNKTHKVENRIVSLFQHWVRPMVRGKNGKKVEFGSKINANLLNGFTQIGHLDWEAFNEGTFLIIDIEHYYDIYGYYPEYVLVDQIYHTRANRKYMDEKDIKYIGKPLGRPPKKPRENSQQRYKKRKKNAERNHIEGKFGQAKRGYGLNNIKARTKQTSESWIASIFFVMNLTNLLKIALKKGLFFVPILKQLYNWIIDLLKNVFLESQENYSLKLT